MEKVTIYFSRECVICMEALSDTLFGPCQHECTCSRCAATISTRGMPCPLCRQPIESTASEFRSGEYMREPVPDGKLSLWIDTREAYLQKLRGKTQKGATMKGKSKLARTIKAAVGDALQEARMQDEGSKRVMSLSRTTYALTDGDVLTVTYKPKGARKPIQEVYQYAAKEELEEALKGGEPTSAMELATYDPQLFYLTHYHYGGVDEGLQELGLVAKRRRRSRAARE